MHRLLRCQPRTPRVHIILQVTVLAGIGLLAGCSQERDSRQTDIDGTASHISVVAVAGFDEALAGQVVQVAASNLRMRTEQEDLSPRLPRSSSRIADTVRDLNNDAAAVFLVLCDGGIPSSTITNACAMASDNIVVLDVSSLRDVTGAAHSSFGRRVEKQSLKAIGQLAGLGPCPSPRCCLFAHKTALELDAKGGNYCPPCLVRTRHALKKKGIAAISPQR